MCNEWHRSNIWQDLSRHPKVKTISHVIHIGLTCIEMTRKGEWEFCLQLHVRHTFPLPPSAPPIFSLSVRSFLSLTHLFSSILTQVPPSSSIFLYVSLSLPLSLSHNRFLPKPRPSVCLALSVCVRACVCVSACLYLPVCPSVVCLLSRHSNYPFKAQTNVILNTPFWEFVRDIYQHENKPIDNISSFTSELYIKLFSLANSSSSWSLKLPLRS